MQSRLVLVQLGNIITLNAQKIKLHWVSVAQVAVLMSPLSQSVTKDCSNINKKTPIRKKIGVFLLSNQTTIKSPEVKM